MLKVASLRVSFTAMVGDGVNDPLGSGSSSDIGIAIGAVGRMLRLKPPMSPHEI